MTEQPPIDPALFEVICAKEWFEKYGAQMMPGYFEARITAYKRIEKEKSRSRPAPSAPAPNQHVCPHLEYRNDVGFCHYHDNPIQLNTMPEGTTCEECQRFRKPECPYPGSNITMNKCKAFLINLQQHDASIRNETLKTTLDNICKQCPIREETPIDDERCAESCEGCLARMVILNSLRSTHRHQVAQKREEARQEKTKKEQPKGGDSR